MTAPLARARSPPVDEAYAVTTMLLVVIAAACVALLVLVLLLPRAARPEPGRGLDYGAMADVEAHDIDDMLSAIDERRHRSGRRSVGEELADELTRGSWRER